MRSISRCITWVSWACRAGTSRSAAADFIPESAQSLNAGITIAALLVGCFQLVFLFNLIWSYFKGKPAGGNPWSATTLEWQTPDTPPKHGNFGKTLPLVYRWAYDYSVPGAKEDFIPQNVPPREGATAAQVKAWYGVPGADQDVSQSITLLVLGVVMAVVIGWLLKQTVNVAALGGSAGHRRRRPAELSSPPVKIGLWVFLAVVTSLFALFISAYAMRMGLADWNPLPEPWLLWLNTAVLVLASVADAMDAGPRRIGARQTG